MTTKRKAKKCPKTYRGKKVTVSKGACFVKLASGKKKRVAKVSARTVRAFTQSLRHRVPGADANRHGFDPYEQRIQREWGVVQCPDGTWSSPEFCR